CSYLLSLDPFSNNSSNVFFGDLFPPDVLNSEALDSASTSSFICRYLTSDIISLVSSEVSCLKQFAEKSSDHTWLCLVGPAHLFLLSFPALIQAALILFPSGK
ncbi:hypothetical protein ILYODFUR_034626, partial [Ilyodon furcidens]